MILKYFLRDFTFTSYVPFTMHQIRNDQRIKSEELLHSFSLPMKAYGKNAGKSGAKLYLTHDEEYVVKTVSDKESEMLSKMAAKYRRHMKEGSLLTVFVGSFRFLRSHPKKEDIRLVVMKNLAARLQLPYKKFDLKGIVVSKHSSDRPRFEQNEDPSLTYMEDNFMEDYPNGLVFGDSSFRTIYEMMEKDIDFLKSYNIVDYSLLLIITPNENSESGSCEMKIDSLNERPTPKNRFLAHAKQIESYDVKAQRELQTNIEVRLAIIDILVHFGFLKNLERSLKRVSLSLSGKDPGSVTIQTPGDYAKRFTDFFHYYVFPIFYSPDQHYYPERTISDPDFFNFDTIIADMSKIQNDSSKLEAHDIKHHIPDLQAPSGEIQPYSPNLHVATSEIQPYSPNLHIATSEIQPYSPNLPSPTIHVQPHLTTKHCNDSKKQPSSPTSHLSTGDTETRKRELNSPSSNPRSPKRLTQK